MSAFINSLVCVQKSQKVSLIDSDDILHNTFFNEIEYGVAGSYVAVPNSH
jgi:hypothetical protein